MVELTLEREVFPKQHEFLTASEPFVAFVGGRGSGKTRAGAEKTLHYLLKYPGSLGIITAPTYKMLRDATWRTCLEMWPANLIPKDGINLTDMRIKLGSSEVLFRSTEDAEHLRGPSIGFFWMDEGAESSEDAFQILQGCLRQEGRPLYAWVTSTPRGYNWLYQYFMTDKTGYRIITCSSKDNPFLPPDFVKSLEDSYRDDYALQEIEGQFVVVGGQCVFDLAALRAMLTECREPMETVDGAKIWQKPVVGSSYVIGADVGMVNDYSAAVCLNQRTGQIVATIRGHSVLDEYAEQLARLGKLFNYALLAPEANSFGEVVVSKLKQLEYPRLYKEKDRFGWLTRPSGPKRKEVIIMDLEEALRRRQMVIFDKAILDELFLYTRNERGQFMATEGGHDDLVMALAIAWQIRNTGSGMFYEPVSYVRRN